MALNKKNRFGGRQMVLALVVVFAIALIVTWGFSSKLAAEPSQHVTEVDNAPLAGGPAVADSGVGSGTGAGASTGANSATGSGDGAVPCDVAYQYLMPEVGAPCNGCDVPVGQQFTLDLMVNAGSSNVSAQQSYMKFDGNILRNVDSSGAYCATSPAVNADTTQLDMVLQNEVCDGTQPCTMRNRQVEAGSIGFASGALNSCTKGCTGQFRAAQVSFCTLAPGKTTLRWEFTDPLRQTNLVDINSKVMSKQSCYRDYVINVTDSN